MDEVVVSFAVEKMLTLVSSLANEGISLFWGFKGELKQLEKSLNMIQNVLHDAEQKQVAEESVRQWLESLQDIAYDAEDALDEFAYEMLRRKVEIKNQLKEKVRDFFSSTNPLAFRVNMALKVKKINESLVEIRKKAEFLKLVPAAIRAPLQLSLDRKTDSFLGKSEIVIGRENDLTNVMNLLSSSDSTSDRDLSVITIVGMAGLGKTALAKKVCQVVEEKKLFDKVIWVCVSENFEDEMILGKMLQNLNPTKSGMNEIDALLRHLREELKEKTCLLILDDVWNEEQGRWNSLKDRLLKINAKNGNAVVVTTRSGIVASIMETSIGHRHELKKLSDDDSWCIIEKKVTADGRKQIGGNLKAIGEEIAKKCGGVPLAAIVVGGTMSLDLEEKKWLSIRDRINVLDLEENKRTLHILKLGFERLPLPSLKRCFAYCSVFPKDFDIQKDRLIQLWMAVGLLGPSNGGMEDKGDDYFDYLLEHSFFQDVKRDGYGNVTGCKMHDLMHELALSVSKSETLILDTGSVLDDKCRIRHLNLLSYRDGELTFLPGVAKKLRSLFMRFNVFRNYSRKFKCLQSLILEGYYVKDLPDSICRLRHLRYLDVSQTLVGALPESITKLYHLQTLRLRWTLEKLPKKMSNLVSLRHLYLTADSQMPAHVGCLTNLQTLPLFVVGPARGHKIEELGCLKKLRGRLRIAGLEHVSDKKEAGGSDLLSKAKISDLELKWSRRRESNTSNMNDEDVLGGLQAHPDTRFLKINNYFGEKFPPWLLTPVLHNLVMLELVNCRECKQLPSLGHLPCLEELYISRMGSVICIGNEFYSSNSGMSVPIFPALKTLRLSDMESLVQWMVPAAATGGVQQLVVFPCLERLFISSCPKLKSIPSMTRLSSHPVNLLINDRDEFDGVPPSLKYLTVVDCGNLASIPSIQRCTALEELHICNCRELMMCNNPPPINSGDDFGELLSLRSLSINRSPKLTSSSSSLAISGLLSCSSSLERLVITDCNNKLIFQLSPLSSCLRSLYITDCPILSDFPEHFFRGLTRLEDLTIGRFSEELEEFPVGIMNSIQHYLSGSGYLKWLTICGWVKLKSIPHQLQHLTSLKSLTIDGFNGEELEEALPDWLGNLSSLQNLCIEDCKNLKYVASSTAMQSLSNSNLVELQIYNCPLLEENCAKGSGSEWPKIMNIPKILLQ